MIFTCWHIEPIECYNHQQITGWSKITYNTVFCADHNGITGLKKEQNYTDIYLDIAGLFWWLQNTPISGYRPSYNRRDRELGPHRCFTVLVNFWAGKCHSEMAKKVSIIQIDRDTASLNSDKVWQKCPEKVKYAF